MNPRTVQVLIQVGIVLLIGVVIFAFYKSYQSGQEAKKQVVEDHRFDKVTVEVTHGIQAGMADQDRVTGIVDNARDDYQRGYRDAKRQEPAIADWANGRVPDRLRELARERREARERSGCIGPRCANDATAKDPSR